MSGRGSIRAAASGLALVSALLGEPCDAQKVQRPEGRPDGPATTARGMGSILGFYVSDADPKGVIEIVSMGGDIVRVICGSECVSVGFWDGEAYRGMLRLKRGTRADAYGDLSFTLAGSDTIRAQIRMESDGQAATEIWTRAEGARIPPPETPPDKNRSPAYGEYVYVEELPEAIHKATAVTPKEARDAGVSGVVMVQALVGADGRVKDAKVVKSIPMLDAAAVEAVRQWTFKPARTKGQPVEVWVAIPIRFE